MHCDEHVLGIGYGPANLALAIALAERSAGALPSSFVEAQPEFGWHRGMLLPGSRMQVSFLKDLVTLRNPQSRFTFVNYLAERGRLVDFINRQTFFPGRDEFHDYLDWAQQAVAADVSYGAAVVGIQAAATGFRVQVRDRAGTESTLSASALVLGCGTTPILPPGVVATARQWHSSDLLRRVETLPVEPRRIAVIGAGQSAAEAVAYLHDRFRGAEVHAVFARFGYSPADDSPYVNRIFDPATVDVLHAAEPDVRERLYGYHRGTNYAAVDADLIRDLYEREYQETVTGPRRLWMNNASEITESTEDEAGVRLIVKHLPSGTLRWLDCDVVVYATGYAPFDVRSLLGSVAASYVFDDKGLPVVERDYRLRERPGAPGEVYLNGGVEHSHGLSSSLLSNVAVRAGEIAESLLASAEVRAAVSSARTG